MNKFFSVEFTAILANLATTIGAIVSIIAIYVSVKQSKEQYRISQYEYRKKLYDFLKSFKDDWLFYIETIKEMNPLSIALNGFAKEYLESGSTNHVEMMRALTKGYNKQVELLKELSIYFRLSSKQEKKINQILECFAEYQRLIYEFESIHNGGNDENENEVLGKMKDYLKEIKILLLDEVFKDLILKMYKSLKIG